MSDSRLRTTRYRKRIASDPEKYEEHARRTRSRWRSMQDDHSTVDTSGMLMPQT